MRTARQMFEAVLIETAKQRVQPMLLEDFNYLINKVQIMYVNKQYAAFSANQKVDDNTRVLVSRALLDVEKCEWYPEVLYNGLPGAYYECNLPLDYMHILSVECIFQAEKQIYCYNKGDTFGRMAIRMTPDMENSVKEDFYNRPSYRKPYYFIINVNPNTDLPTNPFTAEDGKEGVLTRNATGTDGELPRSIEIGGEKVDLVERVGVHRYGNSSPVRMEIRYGNDDSIFKLQMVNIAYLKSPQEIRLTKKQIDMTEDKSQILEWSDTTCQEITNDLVAVFMENTADQRLSTNMQVNQAVQNAAPMNVPTAAQGS